MKIAVTITVWTLYATRQRALGWASENFLHRFESLATQDHRGHGPQVSTPLQLAISRPEHKGVKRDERVEYWKSPFLSMQVQLKL